MSNKFDHAMNFRHACKLFDETKKISDNDMMHILEAGRKSPSAFGMEPWKFLVTTDDTLKAKLKPACKNQIQVTSCSHLMIILAAIDSVKLTSNDIKQRFLTKGIPAQKLDFYLNLYAEHLEDTLNNDENIYNWTSKQTFIAAANMMTAAAYIGIDTCPLEGFHKEETEQILDIDTRKFQVALVLPFGYRAKPQPKQLRKPMSEILEFI
jgi:nitroreductase